jgi:hypothetical protein
MRTQMFDYQELLHRHSQTKNSADVQAEIREDFAAVLISTLRVELKRVGDDGNSLFYQTPMHWRSRISSRTLGQQKIDRSDIGLTYQVQSDKPFSQA